MQYATNVEHAAAINTQRKLPAYASRAARCRAGGSCATRVAECLISAMSCVTEFRIVMARTV